MRGEPRRTRREGGQQDSSLREMRREARVKEQLFIEIISSDNTFCE
jgi:hypothetical protein